MVREQIGWGWVGREDSVIVYPANQVDPGSDPTWGNRLKSDSYIQDKIYKIYNSSVNCLMARKAEKPKKKKNKKQIE